MKFRQQPDEILKKIGIYSPEDIDLDLVAYSLNATVKRESLSDCEGYIIGTNEKAIITVSKDTIIQRQRFSLGHEIGHWVNDKKKNLTYRCDENDMRRRIAKEDDYIYQREIRANQFASELIIPSYMANSYLQGQDVTFDTAKNLANLFSVSVTCAAIRLVQLSSFPCMLICFSQDGVRRWFKRSDLLDEDIWPHKSVKDLEDVFSDSVLENDADLWIDHPDAGEYSIVQSMFSNSYDILCLVWWKKEPIFSF